MSKLSVTVKVINALLSQRLIVTIQYLADLLSSVENKLKSPDPNDYLPVLSEAQLSSGDVSFKSDQRRETLFKSKTFIFLSLPQFQKLSNAVKLGGGASVLLTTNEKVDASLLLAEGSCVLCCGEAELSQSPQVKPLVDEVQKILIRNDRRMISESEIGFAVLYCSVDQYCNAGVSELSVSSSAPLQQTFSQLPVTMLQSQTAASQSSVRPTAVIGSQANVRPAAVTSSQSAVRPTAVAASQAAVRPATVTASQVAASQSAITASQAAASQSAVRPAAVTAGQSEAMSDLIPAAMIKEEPMSQQSQLHPSVNQFSSIVTPLAQSCDNTRAVFKEPLNVTNKDTTSTSNDTSRGMKDVKTNNEVTVTHIPPPSFSQSIFEPVANETEDNNVQNTNRENETKANHSKVQSVLTNHNTAVVVKQELSLVEHSEQVESSSHVTDHVTLPTRENKNKRHHVLDDLFEVDTRQNEVKVKVEVEESSSEAVLLPCKKPRVSDIVSEKRSAVDRVPEGFLSTHCMNPLTVSMSYVKDEGQPSHVTVIQFCPLLSWRRDRARENSASVTGRQSTVPNFKRFKKQSLCQPSTRVIGPSNLVAYQNKATDHILDFTDGLMV